MDISTLNEKAWNEEVKRNNTWTNGVSSAEIKMAKEGNIKLWVTPEKTVPLPWLEEFRGEEALLLACAGGQQTPLLSSYGYKVTSMDNSESQLNQDRIMLERYDLEASLVKADITTQSFESCRYSLVLSANAFNFIPSLKSLYCKIYDALKDNGVFIFGLFNPAAYLFDEKYMKRKLKVKYTLPFSDERSKSQKEKEKMIKNNDTFEYSHTLEEIIRDLIDSGFVIDGYYSDSSLSQVLDSYLSDSCMAFRARKLIKQI